MSSGAWFIFAGCIMVFLSSMQKHPAPGALFVCIGAACFIIGVIQIITNRER